ncbi:GNAT family N-acetyltransferase [Lutimonas zeaxanthinifaciens]|uniref:GNAT family N-acetyltransferase n=1 Tax=Lutimonas zeaxanthinifaciens TaxID=3060215 RepID=UPI00265D2D37|nr:GNAT family N-acetyltransferase [Lutimonas sp. YSD2104]WKK67448.1 GNAT family N-acetyltransferase [Lutimonas sp. YSD2104]
MIKIKPIEVEKTFPLRKEILRKGMTLSHKMPGDEDKESLHLGLFSDGELACIGSFMKNDKEIFSGVQYQLRGMATSEKAQGKGLGRLLMNKAEQILKKEGVDLIWCNARTSASGFYEKLGYKIVGEAFEVPQVGPHFVMFKRIG